MFVPAVAVLLCPLASLAGGDNKNQDGCQEFGGQKCSNDVEEAEVRCRQAAVGKPQAQKLGLTREGGCQALVRVLAFGNQKPKITTASVEHSPATHWDAWEAKMLIGVLSNAFPLRGFACDRQELFYPAFRCSCLWGGA